MLSPHRDASASSPSRVGNGGGGNGEGSQSAYRSVSGSLSPRCRLHLEQVLMDKSESKRNAAALAKYHGRDARNDRILWTFRRRSESPQNEDLEPHKPTADNTAAVLSVADWHLHNLLEEETSHRQLVEAEEGLGTVKVEAALASAHALGSQESVAVGLMAATRLPRSGREGIAASAATQRTKLQFRELEAAVASLASALDCDLGDTQFISPSRARFATLVAPAHMALTTSDHALQLDDDAVVNAVDEAYVFAKRLSTWFASAAQTALRLKDDRDDAALRESCALEVASDMNIEIADLRAALVSAKEELAAKAEQFDAHETEMRHVASDLQGARTARMKAEGALRVWHTASRELRSTLTDLSSSLTSSQGSSTFSRDDLHEAFELQQAVTRQNVCLEEAEELSLLLREFHQNAVETANEAYLELHDVAGESTTMLAAASSVEAELQRSREDCSRLRRENGALMTRVAVFERQCAHNTSLEGQIDDLSQTITALEDQLFSRDEELSECRREISYLQSQLKRQSDSSLQVVRRSDTKHRGLQCDLLVPEGCRATLLEWRLPLWEIPNAPALTARFPLADGSTFEVRVLGGQISCLDREHGTSDNFSVEDLIAVERSGPLTLNFVSAVGAGTMRPQSFKSLASREAAYGMLQLLMSKRHELRWCYCPALGPPTLAGAIDRYCTVIDTTQAINVVDRFIGVAFEDSEGEVGLRAQTSGWLDVRHTVARNDSSDVERAAFHASCHQWQITRLHIAVAPRVADAIEGCKKPEMGDVFVIAGSFDTAADTWRGASDVCFALRELWAAAGSACIALHSTVLPTAVSSQTSASGGGGYFVGLFTSTHTVPLLSQLRTNEVVGQDGFSIATMTLNVLETSLSFLCPLAAAGDNTTQALATKYEDALATATACDHAFLVNSTRSSLSLMQNGLRPVPLETLQRQGPCAVLRLILPTASMTDGEEWASAGHVVPMTVLNAAVVSVRVPSRRPWVPFFQPPSVCTGDASPSAEKVFAAPTTVQLVFVSEADFARCSAFKLVKPSGGRSSALEATRSFRIEVHGCPREATHSLTFIFTSPGGWLRVCLSSGRRDKTDCTIMTLDALLCCYELIRDTTALQRVPMQVRIS